MYISVETMKNKDDDDAADDDAQVMFKIKVEFIFVEDKERPKNLV